MINSDKYIEYFTTCKAGWYGTDYSSLPILLIVGEVDI